MTNSATLPTTLLNGATVLKRHALPGDPCTLPAEIVLCHLPHNVHTPYATWQRNTEHGAGGTYWGHYFATESEASADYAARIAKAL